MPRSKTPKSQNKRQEPAEPPPTWDERLIDSLRPFQGEIAGIFLFLFGLVTLLGLLGLTRSALLLLWMRWLRQLAGWGSLVGAISLMLLGLYLALRRVGQPIRLHPMQVVGLELVVLTSLPLTHALGGFSMGDAFAGRGGGLIGWALSEPLVDFLGPWLSGLLYLGLLAWGLALVRRLSWQQMVQALAVASVRLHRWGKQMEPPPLPARPEPESLGNLPAAAVPPDRAAAAPPPPARPRPRLLPPLELLAPGVPFNPDPADIARKKQLIIQTLADFGLPASIADQDIRVGPVITQFGVEPGHIERSGPDGEPRLQRVRVGQIAALHKDLALALAVPRLRIEAPVPGRGVVGVEVPNAQTSLVRLRPLLEAAEYQKLRGGLSVGLGRDVAGNPVLTDLARLPHLLIAGTTGSGKSVCLNALITNLIANNSPDELKLILIDPKRVELIRFNGLPHLLGPVETDQDRIIGVLRWVTAEMDERYKLFADVGARNLGGYNRRVRHLPQGQPLPYILVFVDELSDLMAGNPADVERTLCRLAQMARATGIHLVVATQRPSTDVITGLIKANFPARIAFAVASGIDSRVILDYVGAENLQGQGDMLFLAADASLPVRVQGCFVSDEEIERMVRHWQEALPDREQVPAPWEPLLARMNVIEQTDDMLEQAIAIAQKYDTISTSMLQRRLRVGYPRAARLMEALYEMGMVDDPKQGGRTRRSLVTDEQDDPLQDYLAQQEEDEGQAPG